MSTLRQPVAPVRADEALGEVAREVLVALRRRRLQAGGGAAGAMTRAQLVQRLSAALGRPVHDRTLREAIEVLRRGAHPVVSHSGVSGYWLSDDPAEIGECANTYMGRIRHHAASARGLRRAAAAAAAEPERQGRLLG